MPWTDKQHRLFEAAAHSPAVAKRVGIPQQSAEKLASEGVKPMSGAARSAAVKALRK